MKYNQPLKHDAVQMNAKYYTRLPRKIRMNWISVTDRLPEAGREYLTARFCEYCLKGPHMHKLNYSGPKYRIMMRIPADMTLVNWYQAKGDHSWDWCSVDRWDFQCKEAEYEITHWMEFPLCPDAK